MIRREVTSPDGTRLWLLISQVEHARVSGTIAQHWQEPFTPDVVAAIAHHDDGWAAWEAEPEFNPDLGAPLSFLEMPLPVALDIWDQSITAAAQFGPLAGYLVAGHFYELLSDSEQSSDAVAVAWLTAKRKLRTAWIDNWVRENRSHTLEYAKRAQQMLLLGDLFSLWLCGDARLDSNESILDRSETMLQTSVLFDQVQLGVSDVEVRRATGTGHIEGLHWSVAVEPYPLDTDALTVSAPAIAARARRYAGWQELESASWPLVLDWRLHE